MFEDFGSTGKGVGIIGILIGTFVLACFSGLGFAVYSELGTGGGDEANIEKALTTGKLTQKARETSITELNQKLETYKNFEARMPEISSNQRELSALNNEVESLQAGVAALNETILTEKLAFETYRQQYRNNERKRAAGEIVDFSSTHGEHYKNVPIRKIDAEFLQVMTSSGPKGIPFAELPADIQDRFQFSKDEAESVAKIKAQFQKKQAARQAVFDKAQAAKNKQRNAQKRIDRMKQLGGEIRNKQAEIDKNLNLAKASHARAKQYDEEHRNARLLGKMSMKKGRATSERGNAKTYENRAAKAAGELAKLQAELNRLTNEAP